MKKIFTKLFLLTTLLMLSSELWAALVLNNPGPWTIRWTEEKTFSFNLVGPAESISFELDSYGTMDVNVYGYQESNPTIKVSIAEYEKVKEGVFKYDIKGRGFSRIEIKVKARTDLAKLLNVFAISPYYAYEPNLGSAEYNSADASTSFTIDYYGTPNFSHSYLDGDWDNDKFPVKISASGGKATVTVTYPHDEVGKHDAMIIISNGVFKTTPYRFTGTTTTANQTIAWTPPTELTVGSTHTLSATAPGGAVSYAVTGDAVTRSGNTLTAVKAGTVTITASQAGNNNYNAAASVTKTITIKKATPTVSAWPTIAPVTYGTNLGTALVLNGGSAPVAGTFVITSSYTAATIPNAGAHTYNLEFRPTESNKYNNVAGGTATLTVNKANQTITWTPPTEMTVGDSHTLSATAPGGAVAFAISGDAATLADNTLTAVQAGTVTITASQAGNGNYNPAANVTHTITINKATPTVNAWPTLNAVTYGAKLEQALVLVGGAASVAGTFVITDAYTAATVPNAGTHTYSVEFRPTENNKYNNVSGGTATLSVNKADQVIAWTATPPTEMTVGDSHTLSATALGGAVAFALTGDAATLADNTLTAVQAGTVTITASQAGNSNYNAAENVTHTITINKATPTVTAWPTLDAVTYGATLEQALVLVGGTAPVEGTFVITDAYTAATVPNAGTHTYSVEFRPTESNKYNNVSGGTATLTVNKADQVIAWDFADYTLLIGKTLELDATATCGAVTYVVNGTAISVSGTILTAMEEGTATIKATCAGDTNYNDVESKEYTITVEKDDEVTTGLDNTPSPMTNGQKIIYNGQLLIIRDGKTYNVLGVPVE